MEICENCTPVANFPWKLAFYQGFSTRISFSIRFRDSDSRTDHVPTEVNEGHDNTRSSRSISICTNEFAEYIEEILWKLLPRCGDRNGWFS